MKQQDVSQLSIELTDEQATHHLGKLIAENLAFPFVCYLHGELGVGKTRLVRAIIQSLGYDGNVKSPTYTLVEPYQFEDKMVYHFDLYRLSDPEELDYLGIRDYFEQHSAVFIEWPDKGRGWLAEADVALSLSFNQQGRSCCIEARTDLGKLLIQKLKQDL